MKVLYICLGALIIAVIALSACVFTLIQYPPCDRLHIDDRPLMTKDIIPDEETAEKVAYILLDKLYGIHEERDYDIHINFNEENYAWEVWYAPIPPEGFVILGGNKRIHIRKDNGTIIHLSIG